MHYVKEKVFGWRLHDAYLLYLCNEEFVFCFYVVYSVKPDFFAEFVPFRSKPRNGLFRDARNSAE
jgi:hypothetical protein